MKNGHFEEMGAWSQILQTEGYSALFYLSFDTHDGHPPIYLHWDFMNFWHSPVWNIQLDFFPSLNWEKIPVWNIKLAKSKIPVRVVNNVISKWTKMEFPRFPFLWFTAVGVVNPPDQKLVMYISVNCKKGMNN